MASREFHLCIFEDEFTTHLLPLVYLRPSYDLRCGVFTLRRKIQTLFADSPVTLHCRTYLEEVVRERNPGTRVNEFADADYLFVNGRLLPEPSLAKHLRAANSEVVFLKGVVVVAARISRERIEVFRSYLSSTDNPDGFLLSVEHFEEVPKIEIDASLISYPWDLFHKNGEEIVRDFQIIARRERGTAISGRIYPGVHLVGKKNIRVGRKSVIKSGAVLDAEEGPILIGENVTVFPQATIIGPAYIGERSLVKVGAQIYGGTTIGPMCKVGGEIEGSILHAYANKQHAGFLGHSYLGEWVNLGADTNNSDLKNSYGTVKVDLGFEKIDSKSQFVGLTMGDHSKSGINTMFNTGTVVGVCCNIFGSDFPPKYVPSFSWGGSDEMQTYDINRAVEVARRVMARRNVQLSRAEEKLLTTIFERTSAERLARGIGGGDRRA
ncbi:MAG TPA: GlmU family protein [Bacteroidota bacterium]|nr:GlmU family protein [Bacteroidota bacterium]